MATIDGENAKKIRKAMEVRVAFQTTSLYQWVNNEEIISCFLDLRSVSTDPDNPTLQSSTLEVSFKFASDYDNETFMQNFKGKQAKVMYRAGYWDEYDFSDQRTFYTTMDDDTLQYEHGVITVKATDLVGSIDSEHPGSVVYDDFSYSIQGGTVSHGNAQNLINKYMYEMFNPYISNLLVPTPYNSKTGTIYEKTPKLVIPWDDYKWGNDIVIEPGTDRRKMIGQWMNFFRGCKGLSSGTLDDMKFVFRDAGIPQAGWCDNAISGNSSSINIQTWQIDYEEVADFKLTRGSQLLSFELECGNYYHEGTSETVESLNVENGLSYKVKTEKPYMNLYAPVTSAWTVNNWLVLFTADFTGVLNIGGIPVNNNYYQVTNYAESSEGYTEITVGNGRKVIKLDPFNGLRHFYYRDANDESLPFAIGGLLKFIQSQYREEEVNYPTYATFKWKGDPRMQPRDIIELSHIDGDATEVHYFEIDSLTLEHTGGGLISEIRAQLRQ